MNNESNRKAVKKYAEKTKTFAVKYYPTDIADALRLQKHLKTNGLSCNAYLKELIRRDLDSKQVPYTPDASTQHDDI
jgi:hypothetical protein